MPRFAPLVGVSLAALLALTACSSSEPSSSESAASSTPPSSSSPPSASSSASASSSSASASASSADDAGAGQPTESASSGEASTEAAPGIYSSEDLATALGSVTQADGEPLQVIPTEQLEQSMDQARRFLAGVTITPEECEVFASNSLEAPQGAGVATGVASSSEDAVQTILSVASSSDIGFTEGRLESSATALDACSSFTVEAQGVAINQTVQTVDAATNAEETFGSLTLQSSSDGARQETMTIVGIRGDLAVTAVRTAQNTLPEGTQDELQHLVDKTLAATEEG